MDSMDRKLLNELLRRRIIRPIPKPRKFVEYEPNISERKIVIAGLIISLVVLSCKLCYNNPEIVHEIFIERKFIPDTIIVENWGTVFDNLWQTAVIYSKFWLPVLCGLTAIYFTWMFVYLDSHVPGVNPPSPLSPQKSKSQSGRSFHINYGFAVLIGLSVALYMYFRGVSLQY